MTDALQGKRVLVIGFARQGQALARWLPSKGASVVVNDARPAEAFGQIYPDDYPNTRFIFGGHPEEALRRIDLVCVSGGVPLDNPLVVQARERGIPLANDAQLFLERCPAPVIGITGSAGKTTTTALVSAMMQEAGYRTWRGGNIGNVLLDDLPNIAAQDVVVMELSSFQLDLMTKSPTVGAVLNITPNHIDRHGTMEAYIKAKANIIAHQTPSDMAVLCEDDPNSIALEAIVQGELATYSMRKMVADGAFLAGDNLILAGNASWDAQPHVLCQRADIPLRGDHNVLNVLAACTIAGAFGLATDRPGVETETMGAVIKGFKAVPHRLETVRVLDGVTYVNDSIATAPERLIAALKSYHEPLVVLVGGADKDLVWEQAAHLLMKKARHVVVFGAPNERVKEEKMVYSKIIPLLRLLGADQRFFTHCATLEEAVIRARDVAQAGDVVLLSPGGTSFDAYGDFEARGKHFRDLVNGLA
jgi:UDP-N-acetylmuramoylalanine--D-glutamate ligase